jgi:hypothetical protein
MMYGASLLVLLCCGVDVGWQPSTDGGMEYIIQISPEELQNLRPGDILAASDVPPNLPPIRTYRIVVGSGPLPRRLPASAPSSSARGLPSSPQADQLPNAGPELRNTPSVSSPGPIATAQSAVALMPTEHDGPSKENRQAHDNTRPGDGPSLSQTPDGGTSSPPSKPGDQATPSTSPQEKAAGTVQSQSTDAASPAAIDRRWTFLLIALAALTSAGMCFASWIAWDYRKKYLALLLHSQPEISGGPGEPVPSSEPPGISKA